MRHVFICGAKSVGQYGGYETFVDKLTQYHQNRTELHYHMMCKANGTGCMDESRLAGVERISDSEFLYHNARCVKLRVPRIGPAVISIWFFCLLFSISAISAPCPQYSKAARSLQSPPREKCPGRPECC